MCQSVLGQFWLFGFGEGRIALYKYTPSLSETTKAYSQLHMSTCGLLPVLSDKYCNFIVVGESGKEYFGRRYFCKCGVNTLDQGQTQIKVALRKMWLKIPFRLNKQKQLHSFQFRCYFLAQMSDWISLRAFIETPPQLVGVCISWKLVTFSWVCPEMSS